MKLILTVLAIISVRLAAADCPKAADWALQHIDLFHLTYSFSRKFLFADFCRSIRVDAPPSFAANLPLVAEIEYNLPSNSINQTRATGDDMPSAATLGVPAAPGSSWELDLLSVVESAS